MTALVHLPGPDAAEAFGCDLGRLVGVGDVIALSGALGAGKTTLARGIMRGLGYAGEVSSPTFPIIQVYGPPDTRVPVWHVDLYRIENFEELEELGLEEAADHAALIIEWPDRLARLWPDTLRLSLSIAPDGTRALTADVPPAWERRWSPK